MSEQNKKHASQTSNKKEWYTPKLVKLEQSHNSGAEGKNFSPNESGITSGPS